MMVAERTRGDPRVRTHDTAGGRRIAEAFARARSEGRAALVPYVVAGYPDADGSLAAATTCIDAGADLLEVGLPYSDPLADGATLQRASGAALRAGATFAGSLDLVGRIARARPGTPLVPMGYANQLIGGGDGRDRARALVDAGASGVIVADLTPDEGEPFERVAADAGLAVVYLVRPPRDDRVALGRLPVLRVAGGRDRRAVRAPGVGRPAGARRPVGLADPRRRRVRRVPTEPRARDRAGRRRRRRRRLGARRRAGR
jgi:tryptophan synthase alpha chain